MYSKAISWFSDCRIPFVDDVSLTKKLPVQQSLTIYGGGKGFYRTEETLEYKEGGRFPANILVSDDMLNDGVISKSGSNRKNTKYSPSKSQVVYFGGGNKDSEPKDKGTNSRYYDIDRWFNNLLDV